MKNKAGIAACCLAAMLLCTLAGCQLAREDKGANGCEDRLVGVFVTTQYLDLFDMEGYLNDHLKGNPSGEITIDGKAQEYQGRLYATLKKRTLTNEETGETTETDEYAFEGIHGIPYFTALVYDNARQTNYRATMADDAISDGHTSLNVGDLENSMALEGTVYVSPGADLSTYYLNPVYQSVDGRVYVTSGSGLSTGGGQSEGAACTQTMTASRTLTENGKIAKDSTSIKLTIKLMNPPTKIVVLQMDGASLVVSRREYAPGTLPKAFAPEPRAEYIVVETTQNDNEGNAQVTRRLYGKDAAALETFWRREDGICVKQSTQVIWPN